MANPYPFSGSVGSTLDMLAPGTRATPGPGEQLQAYLFQRVLERADQPGYWGADRYEQTNHFRGMVGIAIRLYMSVIGGARFNVLERTKQNVLKSYGTGHYSRDDEYQPADQEHPLCKIVEQPGGEDGLWSMGQECTFLTLQHMLTGDAPAWCPLNDAGRPVRFFSLTSALVQAGTAAGQDPRWPKGSYRVTPYAASGFYMAGGLASQAILPGEEVKRFRAMHPWGRNMGMSRLQSGAQEIDVLEAIMTSRWAMFDHGMQMDMAALIPGADQATCEKFQNALETRHGGAKNAHRFVVLGGGGLNDKIELKPISQSSREMDYGTSYDQQGGVVLALFGVPKGIAIPGSNSYSQHFAEIQQWWDLGVTPYSRELGVFLTQGLANPWCEKPGQFKIEVEPCKPADIEMEAKKNDTGLQSGAIDVNEWRKANGFKPKPDGDMPLPIHIAKLQQAIAPPPQPGMPGVDGQPPSLGAGAPGEEQPTGDEGQPIDDSPEATQDAVTAAALEALGVPGEEQQPEGVQKSVGGWKGGAVKVSKPGSGQARPKRAEGSIWTGNDGKRYTKKNGQIVPYTQPRQPAAQPAPQQGKPLSVQDQKGADIKAAFDRLTPGDFSAGLYQGIADSIAKTGEVPSTERKTNIGQAWERVKQAGFAKHPEAAQRFTAAIKTAYEMMSAGHATGKAWLDALNKHFAGVTAQATGGAQPANAPARPDGGVAAEPPWTPAPGSGAKPAPGRPTGKPPVPRSAGPIPEDERRGSPMSAEQAKDIAARAIPDERKKAAVAKAAAFAKSPEGKAILAKAHVWAVAQAAKHADRVAAHLKISPELARHLLANTIVMLCKQALASPEGSANQTLDLTKVGGGRLNVGIKRRQGPTSGAVPRPANPAGKGSRPPLAKAMPMDRGRELVDMVLASLE